MLFPAISNNLNGLHQKVKIALILPRIRAENRTGLKITNPKWYLTEALCWMMGLVSLVFLNPTAPHLFSLCPFSWIFENGCPGCGLGRAIAFLYRGQWQASWQAHPLAVPALLLLSRRIYQLVKNYQYLRSYNLQLKK